MGEGATDGHPKDSDLQGVQHYIFKVQQLLASFKHIQLMYWGNEAGLPHHQISIDLDP